MYSLEKILIIRFSSLGDIILTSPLIRALRKTFPEAQIDFLVKSEYANIVKFNPNISSVIELKSDDRSELKWLKQKIRRIRYDLIVDVHNSLRSRFIRCFSKARYKVVVNKRVFRRFLFVKFKINLYRDYLPIAERYLETVEKFGVKKDDYGLEIYLPEDTKNYVSTISNQIVSTKRNVIIGLVPTARHFTKRWLYERFAELGVEIVRKYQSTILIFGSKEEHDYCEDITQMINARSETNSAVNYAGKLTVLEIAAMFDVCNLIITNDSGLMHLAAARKRKIVAIFGSTVKEFGFFPYGTSSIVVENKNLSCRPCSHIGLAKCPKEHFRCMKEIQVKEVLNAVQSLLEQ